MRVIVPTLGRAGRSQSMRWLEHSGRDVTVAIHSDEAKLYKEAYPWAKQMVLPDTVRKHAGKLRHYIMVRQKEPFFFVDDDIQPRFIHVPNAKGMFHVLEKHMAKVCMAAIGKQIFSQGLIKDAVPYNGDKAVVRNKFASTVYGIDPAKFKGCPLEDLAVYEDVALIIHSIQMGGNIVSFSATHTNKSPADGGCNSWRTKGIVLQSLDALVAAYPEYCKKIETKHTAHGHDLGVGVRVAWSKVRAI